MKRLLLALGFLRAALLGALFGALLGASPTVMPQAHALLFDAGLGSNAPQEWLRKASDPTDKDLRRAWDALEADKQQDLSEWFSLEVEGLRTWQSSLIEGVIRARGEDVGQVPEAREPRYFDPEEHAPKLPIPRKWLPAGSKKVESERERLLGKQAFPQAASAWTYDWGLGELARTGPDRDPQVIFHNALLGLAPDADLATACVLEALDSGEEQVVLEAFGHTYTDRKGNAYTGISLYEAWGSGRKLEMPDVDNLGIVHTVLGIKRKWKSPVKDSLQESLYEAVGEQYTRAKRYRGLREAMAAIYLGAEPSVPAGYETNTIRLHALWVEAESTPANLSEELPGADKWQRYLEKLLRRVDRDKELIAQAQARQGRLSADQVAIRATLVRVMRESGALAD